MGRRMDGGGSYHPLCGTLEPTYLSLEKLVVHVVGKGSKKDHWVVSEYFPVLGTSLPLIPTEGQGFAI